MTLELFPSENEDSPVNHVSVASSIASNSSISQVKDVAEDTRHSSVPPSKKRRIKKELEPSSSQKSRPVRSAKLKVLALDFKSTDLRRTRS